MRRKSIFICVPFLRLWGCYHIKGGNIPRKYPTLSLSMGLSLPLPSTKGSGKRGIPMAKKVQISEELKAAKLGDKILLSDGSKMEFVKLNRTKFLAKNEKGMYSCPVSMFVRVTEQAPPEPAVLTAMKVEAKKWFRKEIQTGYGPSIVKGFVEDEKGVYLLEFGEELYSLSLEDFLGELVQYNDAEIHLRDIPDGNKYTVELTAFGNPDFDQSPTYPMCVHWTVGVQDFREASKRCLTFIAKNSLGGGNWSGGQIHDRDENLVANVSYNGRVWDKDMKNAFDTPVPPYPVQCGQCYHWYDPEEHNECPRCNN